MAKEKNSRIPWKMASVTDNFLILFLVITSNFRVLKMFKIKEPQFWVCFEFSQGNNH
jgi:hypothetical protein